MSEPSSNSLGQGQGVCLSLSPWLVFLASVLKCEEGGQRPTRTAQPKLPRISYTLFSSVGRGQAEEHIIEYILKTSLFLFLSDKLEL